MRIFLVSFGAALSLGWLIACGTGGSSSTGSGGNGGSGSGASTSASSSSSSGVTSSSSSSGGGSSSSGGGNGGGMASSSSGVSSSGAGGASSSAASSSSSAGGPTAVLPIAPGPDSFMWQGTQRAFLDDNGNVCAGVTVAIAVGDRATCYVAAGGGLKCAGSIGTNVYGGSFTAVPSAGLADQILISPTFNAANHNSVCVRRTDGTAACMGENNDQGQFGKGNTTGASSFVGWGNVGGISAIGTGTWDQICGLTTTGDLFCAGLNAGSTPALALTSVQTFYVDTFGMNVADDPNVLRVANGRTDCLITTSGLACNGPPNLPVFGIAGHVVDGTYTLNYTPPNQPPGKSRYCWLDDQGHVACAVVDMFMPGSPQTSSVFTAHRVLALAGNPYTTSLCAVYEDGSIVCKGNNDKGQLGTNASIYLNADTIVAPPGSVDLACK